jgi:hypothetical protein
MLQGMEVTSNLGSPLGTTLALYIFSRREKMYDSKSAACVAKGVFPDDSKSAHVIIDGMHNRRDQYVTRKFGGLPLC